MTRNRWWQQLQSGVYPTTKLKYGDSNWVIGKPPNPKTSPKTSTSRNTQSSIPKNLPKQRFNTESQTLTNKQHQFKPVNPATIREPQITIAKIKKTLNEVTEINKLHEMLYTYLTYLRGIYKINKLDFSKADIILLDNARNISDLLTIIVEKREELVQEIRQFRKQYPDDMG